MEKGHVFNSVVIDLISSLLLHEQNINKLGFLYSLNPRERERKDKVCLVFSKKKRKTRFVVARGPLVYDTTSPVDRLYTVSRQQSPHVLGRKKVDISPGSKLVSCESPAAMARPAIPFLTLFFFFQAMNPDPRILNHSQQHRR